MATRRSRPWATDQSTDDPRRSAAESRSAGEADGPAPVETLARAELEGQEGMAPPRGRGFDRSSAAMLLGMQQRAGNQAVQRYLHGATLQREEAGGATAQATPADPTAATGATGGAGGGAAAGKTASLRLSALYENVPGKAKNTVRRADSNDSLWFDPLHMKSEHPTALRKTTSRGVVAGGETTIETFAAPMTQSEPAVGRGSITAQLKYADNLKTNLDVQVGGVTRKENAGAKAIAEAAIQREMSDLGDVEDIVKVAEAEVKQTYPNATVSISVKSKGADKVVDAGRSTFYYKVRNAAGILMQVRVVPAGEEHARSAASKTKTEGSEDDASKTQRSTREQVDVKKDVKDSEHKTATSKESVEIAYNKAVERTLDEYVTSSQEVHKTVASSLATEVVSNSTYKDDDKWVKKREFKDVTDYTKNIEKGERDKGNLASKLKKVTGIAKKVTSLPIRLPKWARRVKGWWLDAADWVLGQFAETGKVQYEDTKAKSDREGKDDVTQTRDRDVTRKDDSKTTRELEEEYLTATKDDWERHLKDVTTVKEEYGKLTTKQSDEKTDKTHTEDYSKTGTKDETEASERHKATQGQVITTNFEVTSTYKYTVPEVKARPVAGDVEVSNEPYPAEPGETAENLP